MHAFQSFNSIVAGLRPMLLIFLGYLSATFFHQLCYRVNSIIEYRVSILASKEAKILCNIYDCLEKVWESFKYIITISGGIIYDSRKRHEKRVIFKIGTIHLHAGSTNDFLLFDPFIVSIFVPHVWIKAVTSHLFTPLFMFIHLPLIHFSPPPRLLIDFKNSKWLTYFCILLCSCYCFSHRPDWPIFGHMTISLI